MGRVMAARMDKEEDGSSFVRLQIAITDPVAIQKVLDKRYLTGSVGGRAGKAVCSISGEDLAAESGGKPPVTRFKRGQVYKGKLAYIDMQDISFKEYSFVNQPADSKSSVRTVKSPGSDSIETSDSEWVAKSSAFILSMDEEDIYSLEENQSILEPMKKKESKPLYLHLKGAFLTAMAVHESENYNKSDESLLSNENESNNTHGENSKMKDNVQQDDVLAAVEGLSEDLSAIASGNQDVEAKAEESTEAPEEETSSEEAPESEDATASEESEKVQEADVSSVAANLQKVLNDTIVLSYVAQRAHWNVVDENFSEYHALFATIYEDLDGAIDPLAENIRKLKGFPEGLTSVVMNASFKDDTTVTDGSALISDLLSKNEMVLPAISSAFAEATGANEQGIADFLAGRDDMHKKWSWQLRSSLGEEAGEPADESWRIIGSPVVEEKEEELKVVDSEVSENAEENTEVENSDAELTSTENAPEQNAEESNEKVQLLEEENRKLKNALHRTLAERVVDTKIATGVEPAESREDLIEEHVKRSASSLADSLRDLARMPFTKSSKNVVPEINSEVEAVEGEGDVVTIDKQEVKEEVKEERSTEQVFVDALMGRRKL